jgi:hypothetical protein
MASTYLTDTKITRKALAILHQKLNFIGSINRQYDDRFAQAGAKIGTTLQIRKPVQFAVRTGVTLDVQDTVEEQTTLTVSTVKGVDFEFGSVDLTMSIDDFSDRYLEPAMARLASEIESDAMSMYKEVPNEVSDVGAAITIDDILDGQQVLTENLTPKAGRCLNLNPTDQRDLIDAMSGAGSYGGLYHPESNMSQQFREGLVADRFLGYDKVYENTLWPTHTTGTEAGVDTGYNVTAVSSDGLTLTVDTGTATFLIGDIITITGINDVHPETKNSLGKVKQFVITANSGASATTLSIYPPALTSGARQTCTGTLGSNEAVNKVESDRSTAITASADYKISMGYHKDAFTFVSADLVQPKGVDMSAREVYDGISMSFVRDFDIVNRSFPCRFDILYGYKAIRPEWAVRYGMN